MRLPHVPSTSLASVVEVAVLLTAFFVAVLLRFGQLVDYPLLLPKAFVSTAVIAFCLSYADLFEGFGYRSRVEEALRVVQSLLAALLLLTLVYWAFPAMQVGRGVLTIHFVLGGAVVLALRQVRLSAAGNGVPGATDRIASEIHGEAIRGSILKALLRSGAARSRISGKFFNGF